MPVIWKPWPKGPYGVAGESGYLGKIKIANVTWNLSRSRGLGSAGSYVGTILLPGFKRDAASTTKATAEEVKQHLERQVAEWCKAAELA